MLRRGLGGEHGGLKRSLLAGTRWLVEGIENDRHREATPIGFYFAKLWYYEELYPLIFAVGALKEVGRDQSDPLV